MAAAKTKKRSIIIGNKEYTMPQKMSTMAYLLLSGSARQHYGHRSETGVVHKTAVHGYDGRYC